MEAEAQQLLLALAIYYRHTTDTNRERPGGGELGAGPEASAALHSCSRDTVSMDILNAQKRKKQTVLSADFEQGLD